MTRLLLVRHAESTWNAMKRWQGQADPPLSSRGETQAARALAAVPPGYEQVVTSDLRRARRTAELLASGLDLPCVVEPRLRERHAGPWQGLTRVEIDARWPGMLDDGCRPDDYEPDDDVAARALGALDEVSTPSIVITHGGVLRVLEARFGVATTRIPNLSALPVERDIDGYSSGERFDLVPDGAVATEAESITVE
jgi:broad specificity phosphatase PhoE